MDLSNQRNNDLRAYKNNWSKTQMKRTVKIKAICLNNEDKILLIGTVQRNIKNYVWSRYSGIGSLLKQSGWTIRDELIQKDLLSNKIPKTLSRIAIE